MEYMLPLDEVDETHATFRIPPPVVDIHTISSMPNEGGPVEVKMDKEEWRGGYNSPGTIRVDVTHGEFKSEAMIQYVMIVEALKVVDRMVAHGERLEADNAADSTGTMFLHFASQLYGALKFPDTPPRI